MIKQEEDLKIDILNKQILVNERLISDLKEEIKKLEKWKEEILGVE